MAIKDKGEQILDSMLMDQYSASPNLKEFYMCFIAELDFLFETIQESYEGRMLENAVGEAQDIIGIILDEERNLVLSNDYFGFQGASGATKMADEATPSDGGIFRSEEETGFSVTPLSDAIFRRLLKSKASILNSDTCNVEDMYSCITILLDRQVSNMAVTYPAAKQIVLTMSSSEVSSGEEGLINYASKWFIPTGVQFTLTRT